MTREREIDIHQVCRECVNGHLWTRAARGIKRAERALSAWGTAANRLKNDMFLEVSESNVRHWQARRRRLGDTRPASAFGRCGSHVFALQFLFFNGFRKQR